ncbi:MAG TPA: sulfatase [Myxococcota bacterium]
MVRDHPALWVGSLALALCLALGCSEGKKPNVLLITLDTVRADHLSSYGYARPTTPNLDAFAGRATRFTTCFATSPWTVPSHASLFTGRHPFEHGAHSFEPKGMEYNNVFPLDESHETLAEVLAGEGYVTAGIVANNVYLDPLLNLQQGFETWDVKRVRGHRLTRRAFRWLERSREQPFFLFLNYLDAHRPYNVMPVEGERRYPKSQNPYRTLDALISRVMIEGEPPDGLGELVTEQYDRALRNLDAQLGRLLAWLEERGLYDDTLIVITSDHGEYFGEHGLVEHSKDVYRQALAVPLIVKRPGQNRGEIVDTPASLVDVPRMILAGISEELLERHGERFPYELGNHPLIAENYFSRPKDVLHPVYGSRFRRVRTALIDDGYKLIHSSDGRHELYWLADDPDEASDASATQPDRLRQMLGALEQLQAESRWVHSGDGLLPLKPEQIEALRRLGYVPEGGEEPE